MKRVVICEITCKNTQSAKELEKEIIDLITKEELSSNLVDSAFTDVIDEKLALTKVNW